MMVEMQIAKRREHHVMATGLDNVIITAPLKTLKIALQMEKNVVMGGVRKYANHLIHPAQVVMLDNIIQIVLGRQSRVIMVVKMVNVNRKTQVEEVVLPRQLLLYVEMGDALPVLRTIALAPEIVRYHPVLYAEMVSVIIRRAKIKIIARLTVKEAQDFQ
jgi:hypothetical protein